MYSAQIAVMEIPTGIPPHVDTTRNMKKIVEHLEDFSKVQVAQKETISQAIHDSFENTELEAVRVANDRLQRVIDSNDKKNEAKTAELKQFMKDLVGSEKDDGAVVAEDTRRGGQLLEKNAFHYNSKYWQVPKVFSFPKRRLDTRLRFWLKCMTVKEGNILPFRKLRQCMLPILIMKNTLKTSWTLLFKYLEDKLTYHSQEIRRL